MNSILYLVAVLNIPIKKNYHVKNRTLYGRYGLGQGI